MSRPRMIQIPARWLIPDEVDLSWQSRAQCRSIVTDGTMSDDSPIFPFPADSLSSSNAFITSLCRRCPVRRECLSFAVAMGYTGVWGGEVLTESDLREYRKALKADALALASERASA